jgi:hypothetical protein
MLGRYGRESVYARECAVQLWQGCYHSCRRSARSDGRSQGQCLQLPVHQHNQSVHSGSEGGGGGSVRHAVGAAMGGGVGGVEGAEWVGREGGQVRGGRAMGHRCYNRGALFVRGKSSADFRFETGID